MNIHPAVGDGQSFVWRSIRNEFTQTGIRIWKYVSYWLYTMKNASPFSLLQRYQVNIFICTTRTWMTNIIQKYGKKIILYVGMNYRSCNLTRSPWSRNKIIFEIMLCCRSVMTRTHRHTNNIELKSFRLVLNLLFDDSWPKIWAHLLFYYYVYLLSTLVPNHVSNKYSYQGPNSI